MSGTVRTDFDIRVCYVTNKLNDARTLDKKLKSLNESSQVYPSAQMNRAMENIIKKKFSVIILDDAFSAGNIIEYVRSCMTIIKNSVNEDTPVIVQGNNYSELELAEIFKLGIKDFIVKPFDILFVVEKMNILLNNKLKERQLYVAESSEVAYIANTCKFFQISESTGKVKSSHKFEEDEVYYLMAPEIFGEENKSVWARCLTCFKEVGSNNYEASFSFLAITEKQLSFIRKWIKDQHIEGKKMEGYVSQ